MNEQNTMQWLTFALLVFIALTVGLAVFGGGF